MHPITTSTRPRLDRHDQAYEPVACDLLERGLAGLAVILEIGHDGPAALHLSRHRLRGVVGLVAELTASGLVVLGDKGYLGEDTIRTPYRERDKPASQKEANRAHARLRAPGQRANAQLKTWRIVCKLRCCPWRGGQIAKAIHVLQAREVQG